MAAKAGLHKIGEISEYTGIPVSTLRFMRHQHRGPKSALVAGRIVYRLEDVDRWLDEQFENDPTNTAA